MPARRRPTLDRELYAALVARQTGMIARRQLVDAGAAASEIRTMLSNGTLHLWLPGVYTTTPGLLAWQQRAWGSVLACWPAMLDRDSALRAVNGPGWRGRSDDAAIQVAVGAERRAALRRPEFVVRRIAAVADRHEPATSPPRMRIDDATLDACRDRDELDVVESLSRTVRARMSTPARLAAALAGRERFPRRAWLQSVLDDLSENTWSVLEHGYLTRVERAHGLPSGRRNVLDGNVCRDVDYDPIGLLVELDGRQDHAGSTQRARDLQRDLRAATSGRRTVRLLIRVGRWPADRCGRSAPTCALVG